VLTHLLDLPGDGSDKRFTELLSQTVTLHWLAQTLKDRAVASIDDYVRTLQQSSNGERDTACC